MQINGLVPTLAYQNNYAAIPGRQAQGAPLQNKGNDNPANSQKTANDQRQIESLKAIDRQVRAHEQAHLSAAGGFATSGASFTFVTGPDGNRYATGGEVGIDTSPVPNNPQATILKAETIRRAALAPAQPSGQDQSVASKASAMAAKARMELLLQNQHSTLPHGSTINFSA